MATNPIYPVAYTIVPNLVHTLHYVGFPVKWKKELLSIEQKKNPKFKSEYGLPTNTLKKMLESWMDGIVGIKPLKTDSCDQEWLVAANPFGEKQIKVLFGMIKAWIAGTYLEDRKVSPMAKQMAKALMEEMRLEEISVLAFHREVILSEENGMVSDEAYQAIPLITANRLLGKELEVCGKTLHLYHSARSELISQPIEDPKSHHRYSYVFRFSVQTTPPDRRAMLLCDMSIRRWAPGRYDKEKNVFSSNAINVHVYVDRDKYCQIPIFYSTSQKAFTWKNQDKQCYDLWGYETLIEPLELWEEVEKTQEKYLIPYKSGMSSMTKTKIGVGVSVWDKAVLHQQILAYLDGMAQAAEAAVPGKQVRYKIPVFDSPQNYTCREDFRKWVAQCAETDKITFEIYGLLQDSNQSQIVEQLVQKLEDDFGCNETGSALTIDIVQCEAGDMQTQLADDSLNCKVARCEEIEDMLGEAKGVTASLFLILGEEEYAKNCDPKQVIRNAFAGTGRVVQFVVPEKDGKETVKNKIDNAVYDLYRQLGVTNLLDTEKAKKHRFTDVRCVGMHICTQVHSVAKKGRFLPIYVDMDLLSGKTRVHCAAFENYSVSYREACLEMARLYWKQDLEQRCVDANRAPAKQKLIELRNRHNTTDSRVLFLVNSDGNTRPQWGGISDKAIGTYEMLGEYIPAQIDVGMQKSPFYMPLVDSGVRVARIRCNAEVPDYFTEHHVNEKSEVKFSSASSVYQYGKTFWSIASKPNDLRFNRSFKESRIVYPTHDYAEKDMIEIYPLQLQMDDDSWEWVRFVDALRQIPIQYNQTTILPLPLHLAKNLTEYLMDI